MNVFEREKCRLRLLIHPWIHIGCCLGFIVCILASPSTADEQLASDRSILDSVVENVANLGVQVQALPTSGVENIEVALPDDVNGAAESMTASEGEFWEDWVSPSRLSGSLRVVAVMSALSLAPALLLMTTCYVRLIVVLSLLRHAIGNQQLPPNQVTTTLAIFLTGIIMWPIWMSVHEEAVVPYTDPDISMTSSEAWTAGISPIREFMSSQIRAAGNESDVVMFLDYLGISQASTFADVPLQALLPAFLISELKVAFLIGFRIFLPFVIIDLVVASVTMSMGMMMVPPTTLSFPLKLMLFVLVDGWHLVVQMLLMSFQIPSM